MGSDDLLRHRGAGAGHANDKDRLVKLVAKRLELLENILRQKPCALVYLHQELLQIKLLVQELPGFVEIQESIVIITAVFIKPPEAQVKPAAVLVL